jgi:hypothetical protein
MPTKIHRGSTTLRTVSSLSDSLLRVYYQRHCNKETNEYQGPPRSLLYNEQVVTLVKIEPHAEPANCTEWTLTLLLESGKYVRHSRRGAKSHLVEMVA